MRMIINNKGIMSWNLAAVISIIIASFVLLFIFIPFSSKFVNLLYHSKSQADCMNKAEWDKIEELSKKFDGDEIKKAEITFFNDNCNLVSFTASHGLQNHRISPTFNLGNQPLLCLCYVYDDSCIKEACYKFNSIDSINPRQFSTHDYKGNNGILRFVKNNKQLFIEPVLELKSPEVINYASSPEYNPLDRNNLINKLGLTFNTREITSFLPIVEVKTDPRFVPEGINNIEGFTMLFDIRLIAHTKNVAVSSLVQSNKEISYINVEKAFIELNIRKERFSKLPENLKNHVKLFYLKNNLWELARLSCSETVDYYLCSSYLNGFSDTFVLSASATDAISIILTNEEIALLSSSGSSIQLITGLAEKIGVPPGLAVAVALQESGLKHFNDDGTVMLGDEGEAVGMFQVTTKLSQPKYDCNLEDLPCNIAAGIDILKKCYDSVGSSRLNYKGCPSSNYDQVYTGWDAALRCYNGWPEYYSCSGDPSYVDNVNSKYDKLSSDLKQKDGMYNVNQR